MCAMNPRLLRPTSSTLDSDAAVYLNAVAQADGQQLEPAVRKAINDFVVGCKRDGIWDAIQASCILAGARTLNGALTPLVGTAPTNNGPFVSGDYNRETGLVGNGSSKYLDSNRGNDAAPQDNFHAATYASALGTGAILMGARSDLDTADSTQIAYSGTFTRGKVNSDSFVGVAAAAVAGFFGVSRSSSSTSVTRGSGTSTSGSAVSSTPSSRDIWVFGRNSGTTPAITDARIAFYSIGESLDLALLDTRVSTLITAIGAAIP
jgi:hypothetical protein